MTVARPRERDRDQIALDLIQWARKDNSTNLNGFCCEQEPPLPPSKLTEYSNQCARFREAYETAKTFLGKRREENLNNNKLHVKAYDLNATTYDYFLKEERRKQAEFENELKLKALELIEKMKASTDKQVTDEIKLQYDALMDQLNSIQAARKISPSKMRVETKS